MSILAVHKPNGEVENMEFEIMHEISMGGFNALNESPVIGKLSNDHNDSLKPIFPGELNDELYIRNTNATGVYQQEGKTCYAFAATSAYINTILRIKGATPPSFQECFQKAHYNKEKPGSCLTALEKLEKHFKYGIKFKETTKISIREIITQSVVVSFTTTKEGWEMVMNGSFLRKPSDDTKRVDPKLRHSCLAEGYSFSSKSILVKNSWCDFAQNRFFFNPSFAHDVKYIVVYFTKKSIQGRFSSDYKPDIRPCVGQWHGKAINCAWMNEEAALYEDDYVCIKRSGGPPNLDYFGYNVDEWINLALEKNSSK